MVPIDPLLHDVNKLQEDPGDNLLELEQDLTGHGSKMQ